MELRRAMGNRVYGCDDCQLFCPFNREAPHTREQDFQPRHQLANADLDALFRMSESEFLAMTEGSAMRRISYEQWQRNLAIALGNGPPSAATVELLQQKLPAASELVAEHIQWAIQELAEHA